MIGRGEMRRWENRRRGKEGRTGEDCKGGRGKGKIDQKKRRV